MTSSEVVGEAPPRFVADDCGDDGDTGEEDVLSLCDLPLYGDAADYSFSSEDASSFGDEFFEFSPRDHRDDSDPPAPSPVWDSRDILFCGKLIPTSPKSNPSFLVKKDTGVVKKPRAITSSPARCDKWYMLAFGLARFPSEMALSEIRRRQRKGKSDRPRGKKVGSALWMQKVKVVLGSSRRDGGDVVRATFGCFS